MIDVGLQYKLIKNLRTLGKRNIFRCLLLDDANLNLMQSCGLTLRLDPGRFGRTPVGKQVTPCAFLRLVGGWQCMRPL